VVSLYAMAGTFPSAAFWGSDVVWRTAHLGVAALLAADLLALRLATRASTAAESVRVDEPAVALEAAGSA
jgi:hypothetical protein